jgi:hypothetical protein
MWNHWTRRAVTIMAGVALLGMEGAGARAQDARTPSSGRNQLRPQGHVEQDQATGATFALAADASGNMVTLMTARDFLLEKAVDPSGSTTIRLTQGRDSVTIAMSQSGYAVQRGTRSARFDPRAPQEADLDAIRSVLLGSPAVRTFRRLSSSFENREEDDYGPLVLSALVDGAIVQMLDGDSGALERMAKRVTKKQRATLRQAGRPGDFRDCVVLYEQSLLYSYNIFKVCYETAQNNPWYISSWSKTVCDWEFLIRAEQYLFQFTACLFPL